MYEKEEVEEKEGKELAKELGAIFQKTSAKESTGIEDLFIKIGLKFIAPSNNSGNSGGGGKKETTEETESEQKIKLKKEGDGDKKKKGCC